MSVRSKVEALERRQSPTGECACRGDGLRPQLLLCRDDTKPPPPPNRCRRCGRLIGRLIVKPGPLPPGWRVAPGPDYQAFDSLMDYYRHAGLEPYEYIDHDGLSALMPPLVPAAGEPS